MTTDATPSPFDDLLAHREWVKRLALRLARDEHAAEDLAQDAWLAALRHPPQREGVRSWFRTVLRRRSHNVHRESTRRQARESANGPQRSERSTAEAVAEADAHRHVVDAVMDLPEPYRSTMVLRHFEQLPVADVARRTGVPLKTAKARLRRGREKLRLRLDGEFGSRAAWCVPLLAGWPGLDELLPGSPTGTGGAIAKSVAATLLGGLLVNKILMGGAAAVVLLVAGLWIAQPEETAGDPAPEKPAVVETDQTEGAGRQHVTAQPGDGTEANAPTDDAVVTPTPDDPIAAFRAKIDALPHRTVTGVVTDTRGRPLEGAVVLGGSTNGPNSTRMLASAAAGGTPQDVVDVPAEEIVHRYSVTTGADGSFTIEIPVRKHLPAPQGEIWLWAQAADHARAGVPVPDASDHVEIRLRDAVRLRVRVLDGKGLPIAQQAVRVEHDFEREGDLAHQATDDDGWTVVHGLPANAVVSVRTRSATRIGDVRTMVRLPESGEIEVVLRDDGKRRVHITAVTSDPSVPVSALFVEWEGGRSELRGWPGGGEATVELPDAPLGLAVSTAVGRGTIVNLAADQDEVTLHAEIPPVRWIEVAIGEMDPKAMDFAGMVRGSLAYAQDLTSLTTDGILRLPLVEGGEYALRTPTMKYRLIGSVGPDRIDMAEAQHRVPVRVIAEGGGPLPAGTTVEATAETRGVRNSREARSGAVGDEGDVRLDLVPGITYTLMVKCEGMAPARAEFRPGIEGGDVAVALEAGAPLRVTVPGLSAAARVSAITFPDFGRIDAQASDGAVVIEGIREGHVLLMADTRVFLIAVDGDTPRSVPTGDTFAPRASGVEGKRMFLIGVEPIADGVHAVGLVGAPLGVPAGRYLPVEWAPDEVVVHGIVELDASSPEWAPVADDAVEWTRGEQTGDGAAAVTAVVDGTHVPLGMVGGGKATKWRSAGAEITLVAR